MIRSLCATIALLMGTQVSALESSYPTTTTTVQTYATSSSPTTQPPLDPSCPQMQMDGNNDVLLPPLLDEDNTHVVFQSGSEDMQVRLLIPKQYSTLKVDFEGASNQTAAVDVDLASPSAALWEFDSTSDPCNVIATSSIPWNQFRKNLGGINEKRYPNSVWYGTQINIETTFDFDLKPETLLAEGDNPHHIQRHTRLVRNVIPFDIHFDLDLNLWAQMNVRSPYLRKASALLETSVLEVTPDAATMARAQLEFVTIIPSPLYLHDSSIAVNDSLLADGLTVEEIVSKRDCYDVNVEAFCTQHWRVLVAPKKCDLNGQYTATMYGACNPNSNNCIQPSPNTMDIVFDITSDDYCGVSQKVELQGSLSLKPTQCNQYMKGSIVTSSPQGAAIQSVEILQLVTSPTLEGQNFLTIFDAASDIEILSFATSRPLPNQVDFQFEWRGKQLRCDVTAQVDAMVRVEFEATAPLLLSASSNSQSSSHMALLEDEDMRMSERVRIVADPAAAESEEAGAPIAAAEEDSAATTAATSSIAAIGVVSALSALM